jgi:hypothetical protein
MVPWVEAAAVTPARVAVVTELDGIAAARGAEPA